MPFLLAKPCSASHLIQTGNQVLQWLFTQLPLGTLQPRDLCTEPLPPDLHLATCVLQVFAQRSPPLAGLALLGIAATIPHLAARSALAPHSFSFPHNTGHP